MDTRYGPAISATVRRARQTPNGSWATIELTATRTVFNEDPGDDALEAKALALDLDAQIIDLILQTDFPNTYNDQPDLESNGKDPRGPDPLVELGLIDQHPEGRGFVAQAPIDGGPDQTMECPEHGGMVMRIRVRPNGSHFYSHNDKSTGGEWCNYQPRSS